VGGTAVAIVPIYLGCFFIYKEIIIYFRRRFNEEI